MAKKSRIFVAAVVFLLLNAGLFFFIRSRIPVISDPPDIPVLSVEKSDADLRSLISLEEKISSYYIDPGEDVPELFSLIEKAALLNDLVLESYTVIDSYGDERISLSASGTVSGILSFLKSLDEDKYPVTTDTVGISRRDDSFVLSAEMHYRLAPQMPSEMNLPSEMSLEIAKKIWAGAESSYGYAGLGGLFALYPKPQSDDALVDNTFTNHFPMPEWLSYMGKEKSKTDNKEYYFLMDGRTHRVRSLSPGIKEGEWLLQEDGGIWTIEIGEEKYELYM